MKCLSFCFAFGTLFTAAVYAEEAPVVSTEDGKVSGFVEEAINGNKFNSYLGIPYAKPPVGELRFKDPVAGSRWEGVRDGSLMPVPCLQIPFLNALSDKNFNADGIIGEEDCLYLNVYTPKDALTRGNIPVMVYVHGGSFFSGSARERQGHVLLNKDVILVVIQYRVGFLGFLSTEDSVIPGNYGLKDQTFALQWIQRNIQNFGGDPQRVTIFGLSGGASSVHFQMLTPKAKGLFHGVIMQSGNAIIPRALSGKHRRYAKYVGTGLGCDIKEGSQAFLQCMQLADARNITMFLQDLTKWHCFPTVTPPRVDGDYLPDHPARLLKEGRYNKANVISGITANEGALFTLPMFARSNLVEELETKFPTNSPHSLQWYAYDEDPVQLSHDVYNYYLGGVNLGPEYAEDLTRMMSDQHYIFGHDIVSQLHARETSVSTFTYELTHRGQWSFGNSVNTSIGRHWVGHGDCIFYVFPLGPMMKDNKLDLETQDDLTLRNIMVTSFVNFATGGHPTPDDSLGFQWEPTSSDTLRYLDLSPTPAMANDKRKEVRKFLSSLPTVNNHILHPELVEQGRKSGTRRPCRDEL